MITDPTRLKLSAEALQRLPSKSVTRKEKHELETHWDFNPASMYSDTAPLIHLEVGHDANFRYWQKVD